MVRTSQITAFYRLIQILKSKNKHYKGDIDSLNRKDITTLVKKHFR